MNGPKRRRARVIRAVLAILTILWLLMCIHSSGRVHFGGFVKTGVR